MPGGNLIRAFLYLSPDSAAGIFSATCRDPSSSALPVPLENALKKEDHTRGAEREADEPEPFLLGERRNCPKGNGDLENGDALCKDLVRREVLCRGVFFFARLFLYLLLLIFVFGNLLVIFGIRLL